MTPHPDPQQPIAINCVVITVSDTRSSQSDRSGQLIQSLLQEAGHFISGYIIIPDEPGQITQQLRDWANTQAQVLIFNGGTGISKRDNTYNTLSPLLEQTLPGFGELFRFLSYQEIGSRAIASRAIAGVYQQKLIFSVPGSTNGVKLAMEKLILPELIHLTSQIT